ncbi:hypothetical protein J7L06_06050 [Candidatus Bathyarchaeota archaeon]|nr:hypothetical protein [Candidatus Bathyarchaeota archaeon]
MTPTELVIYLLILSGFSAASALAVYALRGRKAEREEASPPIEPLPASPPIQASSLTSSLLSEDVDKARRELRILDVERNIYSYAIRHLYEAYAEGKLTEEERDRLAAEYKERMVRINEAISRNQSIIALYELEKMKESLFKLFNERFDEIERKIKDVKRRLGMEVHEEAVLPPVELPKPEVEPESRREKKPVKRASRKSRVAEPPPKPEKSEADERIEKIREEVEKVLQRLEQIEV